MDIDKGEIYVAKNKKNGKCYVGQALKFVSKNKDKRGTHGRWRSHVTSALAGHQDSPALNRAILKYGPDNFDVITICECDISEMDILEKKYIQEYDSMVPKGYNLNEGGAHGRDSEETIQKKRQAKQNFVPSADAVRKSRIGQLGKRRNVNNVGLPDYIYATRDKNGSIINYFIKKFYTNTDFTEFVSKYNFKTLESVVAYLDNLKHQYSHVLLEIDNLRNRIELVQPNSNHQILPEYISQIFKRGLLLGYAVEGLLDVEKKKIPRREFIKYTNKRNLEHAKKFVKYVNLVIKDGREDVDWLNEDINIRKSKKGINDNFLPKYVHCYYRKKVHLGYCIYEFPIRNEQNKIQHVTKYFTSQKFTLEEKLQLTLAFYEQLKEQSIDICS